MKAFIKPFEEPESVKIKFFSLRPGSRQEGLSNGKPLYKRKV